MSTKCFAKSTPTQSNNTASDLVYSANEIFDTIIIEAQQQGYDLVMLLPQQSFLCIG